MVFYTRRQVLEAVGAALGAELFRGQARGEEKPRSPGGVLRGLPPSDGRDFPGKDLRLEVRTLDTPHLPARPATRAQWEARAARLREQVLTSAGLWPMPERTPLGAQIFDRIEEEGFSVEKVYFESYPRFYCTGNLYRPRGSGHKPPFPGVLTPHGHWNYGRLEQNPGDENGGAIPQRSMNLALQGYVVFAYDMVGYNDSFQVPHRYGYDPKARWGLTRQAERLGLWGVGQVGLQLWNSIRSLDFLASLPDVDPERLGVTGASGGGTQTFLLTAVDDRVKVSAPVNMISHFMQGGSICENSPNLRIDTDNVEIGALAAPRPLLMVSATGDWTRDTPRIEYPAIASVYALMDAKDRVAHEQFPYLHNYNRSSREAVYRFFARWLAKEKPQHVEERGDFTIDPGRTLVFARRQPPAGALSAEELMESLVSSARRELQEARPRDASRLEAYRKQFGPAYRTALMAEMPSADDLRWWPVGERGRARAGRERLVLRRTGAGDRVPATLVRPAGRVRAAALLVHPEGTNAALGPDGSPSALARELGRRGFLLFAIDAFQTGEARDPARKMEAEFFSTYNRTDDMERVQDVLTALAYLGTISPRTVVVGQGSAGLWCLLARAFFPEGVAVAADAAGFENQKDEAYLEKLHIPHLRRAGDFQSAALLAPASPLLLHNLAGRFAAQGFEHAFALESAPDRLRASDAALPPADIAAWAMSKV